MLKGTHQALTNTSTINVNTTDEPMKQVSVATYFGMCIDLYLKWDEHIGKHKYYYTIIQC